MGAQNSSMLNKNKSEIRLFVYALLFFILHVVLTAYYIIYYLYYTHLISGEILNITKDVVEVFRSLYTNINSFLLFIIR
uniref:Uncharacterized protein n=1 Tax=Acrobeloides nanus TaxID=290746 RepID=A0A914EN63_9BILA